MRRKKLSYKGSQKMFKKNTGVQRMNALNPRRFRGGIRL